MTIEEFLIENATNLTDDEYNAAMADLGKMDERAWVDQYSQLMQDKGARWNEVDAVKRAKPLANRLREAFGDVGFAPGKAYLEDVYAKDFESDVPRPLFDEYLAKMKQYYDQEKASQNKETGRIRRKREVDNWVSDGGLLGIIRSLLSSDYEKQRYIDDPESALFGEQAPSFGSAENTRWGSLADLGLGAASAVGDAIPGAGSIVVGPGFRAARDVGHKLTGSPYQKDWTDIAKSIASDMAISGATYALPNFRKFQRVADKAIPPVPESVIARDAINDEVKALRTGIAGNTFGKNPYTDQPYDLLDLVRNDVYNMTEGMRDDLFRVMVNDMPDSYLKNELKGLASQNTIDWSKARAAVENANSLSRSLASGEQMRDVFRGMHSRSIDKEAEPWLEYSATATTKKQQPVRENVNRVVNNKLEMDVPDIHRPPIYQVEKKTLNPLEQAILASFDPTPEEIKQALKSQRFHKIFDKGSSATANWLATLSGSRSRADAKRVRTSEEQDQIDSLKATEARFWEAGFEPKKIEGDPLWEAYSEWKEEKAVDAIKKSLLGGK